MGSTLHYRIPCLRSTFGGGWSVGVLPEARDAVLPVFLSAFEQSLLFIAAPPRVRARKENKIGVNALTLP